jgi:hypothetical protein
MNYEKLEQYELSNTDIKKILGKRINIIPYPQLKKYSSFDSCFQNNSCFVLFFETTNSSTGHWQCVFKNNNVYEFWDSYGLIPSGDKNYIQNNILVQLDEIKPYLPDIIDNEIQRGSTIIFNTIDYQKWIGSVSTCGRHVCSRLLHKDLNEKQYFTYLTKYMQENKLNSFDEAVVKITYDIIRK